MKKEDGSVDDSFLFGYHPKPELDNRSDKDIIKDLMRILGIDERKASRLLVERIYQLKKNKKP
jgi:hypothetical protein